MTFPRFLKIPISKTQLAFSSPHIAAASELKRNAKYGSIGDENVLQINPTSRECLSGRQGVRNRFHVIAIKSLIASINKFRSADRRRAMIAQAEKLQMGASEKRRAKKKQQTSLH